VNVGVTFTDSALRRITEQGNAHVGLYRAEGGPLMIAALKGLKFVAGQCRAVDTHGDRPPFEQHHTDIRRCFLQA